MRERRKKPKSCITFGELARNMIYVKVIWNGEVVYDDEEGEASIEDLDKFIKRYEGKTVYKGTFEVTGFHHFILSVEGD